MILHGASRDRAPRQPPVSSFSAPASSPARRDFRGWGPKTLFLEVIPIRFCPTFSTTSWVAIEGREKLTSADGNHCSAQALWLLPPSSRPLGSECGQTLAVVHGVSTYRRLWSLGAWEPSSEMACQPAVFDEKSTRLASGPYMLLLLALECWRCDAASKTWTSCHGHCPIEDVQQTKLLGVEESCSVHCFSNFGLAFRANWVISWAARAQDHCLGALWSSLWACSWRPPIPSSTTPFTGRRTEYVKLSQTCPPNSKRPLMLSVSAPVGIPLSMSALLELASSKTTHLVILTRLAALAIYRANCVDLGVGTVSTLLTTKQF